MLAVHLEQAVIDLLLPLDGDSDPYKRCFTILQRNPGSRYNIRMTRNGCVAFPTLVEFSLSQLRRSAARSESLVPRPAEWTLDSHQPVWTVAWEKPRTWANAGCRRTDHLQQTTKHCNRWRI